MLTKKKSKSGRSPILLPLEIINRINGTPKEPLILPKQVDKHQISPQNYQKIGLKHYTVSTLRTCPGKLTGLTVLYDHKNYSCFFLQTVKDQLPLPPKPPRKRILDDEEEVQVVPNIQDEDDEDDEDDDVIDDMMGFGGGREIFLDDELEAPIQAFQSPTYKWKAIKLKEFCFWSILLLTMEIVLMSNIFTTQKP